MDAVHNIPDHLTRWEACDEALLVGMLEDYDKKWSPTRSLGGTYAAALGDGGG